MKGIKRIVRIVLAALLTVTLCALPTYADDQTATASVMRLEMTEGETQVRNAAGREVTVREGGRLYSGYELTTQEGYVWISLDQDKLIKLDWDTQVTVKKTGKNYEILLEYGSIFFDVEKPLEEDETLDIRTSTLSTGVRGTMGMVTSQPKFSQGSESPERLVTVELLEGTVTLAYYPLDGGPIQTQELSAGTLATLVSTQPGKGEIAYLPLSELTLTQRTVGEALKANPFALMEFVRDETLRDRLLETEALTEEELNQLLEQAESLLKENNQAAAAERQEEQERFDQAVAGQPVTDPVFGPEQEEPVPTTTVQPTATPGRTRPAAVPTPTPTPTPVPVVTAAPAAGDSESDSDSKPVAPTPTPTPNRTVTFTYNGASFATVTVLSGQTIKAPLIQPTAQGAWTLEGTEYDFTQPVEKDLTLIWQVYP